MVRSILFGLFLGLAAASPTPKAHSVPAGQCCFELQDSSTNAILQQSKAGGYTYFNGGFTNGWYCVKPGDNQKLLFDNYGNTCFLNPQEQVVCLDPTPSSDEWTLVKQNGSKVLARNGDTGFWACPATSGSGELVFGPPKSSKSSGCRKLNLKARSPQGKC
jgi:hypothetical protein